jgi:hypothetical protein
MTEPTLFGIGKAQCELINSFANWLSAIGTLAAVVVALYLAYRASRPKVQLSVRHRIVIEPGNNGTTPEFVMFKVVNAGDRPVRITQIGWKVGLFCKRYAVQMYEASLSIKLPVDLSQGQEASWMVPLAARDEPWLTYFAKAMLMPNYRTACFTLRGCAYSSIGHAFMTKPEGNLLSKLRATCESLLTMRANNTVDTNARKSGARGSP